MIFATVNTHRRPVKLPFGEMSKMGVSEDKNLRGEGGNAPIPPGGAIRVLGDHWDPSNPRDVAMINRHARERPRAFAEAGPEAEAVAREMMKLSAQCAREGKERAQTTEDLIDVGKLAAQSGTLATNIRKVLQADDHHADKIEVDRVNAATGAINAGVTKTYVGLNPANIVPKRIDLSGA